MYRKKANIFFVILILFSLVHLLLFFKVVTINETIFYINTIGYTFVTIVITYSLVRFVTLTDRQKPKESVKIIYKDADKEEENFNITEKKTSEKINKITKV